MDVSNLKFEDFSDLSFDCDCGKRHTLDIDKIVYGQDICSQAILLAQKYAKGGKIELVCDQNTYQAFGKDVEKAFQNANIDFSVYMFCSEHDLLPDNRQIGKLLIEISNDITLMIAVGSGVINDITRLVSFKMKIPYMVIGTAPSMDGYASATSSLIINDTKSTIPGHLPKAILADENVLHKAPAKMIKAGFGDVIGKLTALADWDLGVIFLQEQKCPVIVSMVNQAVEKCIDNVDGVRNNEKQAVANVFEALTIAGVTMGLNKNTRPASGAEHHLAHYWDLKAIKNNEEHALHGESVGIGTIVICRLYELAKELLPQELHCPSSDYLRGLLQKAGAKCSPVEIGVTRQNFEDSIIHAHNIATKYTILTHLNKLYPDALKEYAKTITDEFYGA